LRTLESKLRKAQESVEDTKTQMKLIVSVKEKAMEAMQMELAEAHSSLCASTAKITLLLETNALKHEEWVANRLSCNPTLNMDI